MARVGTKFDTELNLKATELSLAIPGSNEPELKTSSSSYSIATTKRSLRDFEDNLTPPSKLQVLGWPPIRSYRKKQGNGSGLYVKVNMDGAPFLRKIDLSAHASYVEFIEALEAMFNVKIGQYLESEGYGDSDYAPSYEDKDGDWMLVGDVPWEMFVTSCKRLRIIKSHA